MLLIQSAHLGSHSQYFGEDLIEQLSALPPECAKGVVVWMQIPSADIQRNIIIAFGGASIRWEENLPVI